MKIILIFRKYISCLLIILFVAAFLSCQDSSKNSNNNITAAPDKREQKEQKEYEEQKDIQEKGSVDNGKDKPNITDKEDKKKYVIVIDPGHQIRQNKNLEPIGPGSKTKKPMVSSGTQGAFTREPEYQVNLDVSLKLKKLLVEKGYQVVMIRESNNVNLSNIDRANIANKNHADVFVRIHCNGSTNTKTNGILTMCPTKKNPYCSNIYKQSRQLSDSILDTICKSTGANNRGVSESDTMSGINWSKVPVSIVEMGYMTNQQEDYLLCDKTYQDKLAKGISDGITKYLETYQS